MNDTIETMEYTEDITPKEKAKYRKIKNHSRNSMVFITWKDIALLSFGVIIGIIIGSGI